MPNIHPTSLIDPKAQIHETVSIGPFCVIGPDVTIEAGTKLLSSVTVYGPTNIGKQCIIHPTVTLGGAPQVLKYDPSKCALVIGNKVTIREGVTISLSTLGKDQPTRVGNGCYIMANVHVAHDCQVGDRVILVQGVGLAGHTTIHTGATVSGLAGVHQNVVIGAYAFVGAGALVAADVLPYTLVMGNRAKTKRLNEEGLRRMGWGVERIASLRIALAQYFRTGKFVGESEDVKTMVEFVKNSKRGVCRPDENGWKIAAEDSQSKL